MTETIYIVDNDDHLLDTCRRILKREPYRCMTFNSPEYALARARQDMPAVVVSGHGPGDMDGIALLEHLRQELPLTVRIMMTGYGGIDGVLEAINRGHVFRFIKKPWDDVTLKIELRHALGKFRYRRQLWEVPYPQTRRMKQPDRDGSPEDKLPAAQFYKAIEALDRCCERISEALGPGGMSGALSGKSFPKPGRR